MQWRKKAVRDTRGLFAMLTLRPLQGRLAGFNLKFNEVLFVL